MREEGRWLLRLASADREHVHLGGVRADAQGDDGARGGARVEARRRLARDGLGEAGHVAAGQGLGETESRFRGAAACRVPQPQLTESEGARRSQKESVGVRRSQKESEGVRRSQKESEGSPAASPDGGGEQSHKSAARRGDQRQVVAIRGTPPGNRAESSLGRARS